MSDGLTALVTLVVGMLAFYGIVELDLAITRRKRKK